MKARYSAKLIEVWRPTLLWKKRQENPVEIRIQHGKVKGTSNDDFEMTERAVKVVDGQSPAGYEIFLH